MTTLDELRPASGWTAQPGRDTAGGPAPTNATQGRDRLTLVADCFDCGGALEILRSDSQNGGLRLRATLACTDCERRWTFNGALVGHPKVPKTGPGGAT